MRAKSRIKNLISAVGKRYYPLVKTLLVVKWDNGEFGIDGKRYSKDEAERIIANYPRNKSGAHSVVVVTVAREDRT